MFSPNQLGSMTAADAERMLHQTFVDMAAEYGLTEAEAKPFIDEYKVQANALMAKFKRAQQQASMALIAKFTAAQKRKAPQE